MRCGLIGFASPMSQPGSIASPHNASAAHRERRAWVMVIQFLTLIPVALALRVAAAHAISATGHGGGRRRHARSTRCVIFGGRLDRRGGTALSIRFGRATCLRRTPASSSAVSAGLARRAWPLVLTRRVFNKLHRTSPRGREPSVDAGRCSGAQRRSQGREPLVNFGGSHHAASAPDVRRAAEAVAADNGVKSRAWERSGSRVERSGIRRTPKAPLTHGVEVGDWSGEGTRRAPRNGAVN